MRKHYCSRSFWTDICNPAPFIKHLMFWRHFQLSHERWKTMKWLQRSSSGARIFSLGWPGKGQKSSLFQYKNMFDFKVLDCFSVLNTTEYNKFVPNCNSCELDYNSPPIFVFLTCRYFNKGAHYSFIAQSVWFWVSTPPKACSPSLHTHADNYIVQSLVNFTEFHIIKELWRSKQWMFNIILVVKIN